MNFHFLNDRRSECQMMRNRLLHLSRLYLIGYRKISLPSYVITIQSLQWIFGMATGSEG